MTSDQTKKVVYRFFVDHEKEEKWINEMSAQGWHLEKFSVGRFVFKKGEPGKYIYRNEFITEMDERNIKEYFDLLKDSGVTIVHQFGSWVYMKKPATEGPFQLFTDNASTLAYYNRLLKVFYSLLLLNICFTLLNVGYSFFNVSIHYFNVTAGIISLLATIIMVAAISKIIKKKIALEEEQQFFE